MFFKEVLSISDHNFLSVIVSSIRLVTGSKSGGQVLKQHGFNTLILLLDANKKFLKANIDFLPFNAKNWNLTKQR